MRKMLQRSWNWIPHREAVINNYLDKLHPKIYEYRINYVPHNLTISVQTDHETFLRNLEDHFVSNGSLFVIEDKNNEISHVKLIYLVNTPAIMHRSINVSMHTLSSSYAQTDVAFDPSKHIALMHGPAKFGFVKSLISGLVSYYLMAKGLHGLHSSLISHGNQGILFAGVHGAGKSSMAFIYALTEPNTTLLSDDWVVCGSHNGHLLTMPLEMNAYLNPEVVKRILDAVPSSETVNKKLRSQLELFIEQANLPETKQVMGADQRMYLFDSSREIMHTPVQVNRLVAFESIKSEHYTSRPFIDLLIDCSYHIPFHSSMSRETLLTLECLNSIDGQTKDLFKLARSRQMDEQKFWLEIIGADSGIVFDTSDEDLWNQYLRLRKLL